MTREIKFRAWHPKSKKMIYESFCNYTSGYGCMFNYDIEPEHLMQSIGQFDKNEVELFSGDVVKKIFVPFTSKPEVVEYYYIGEVIFPNYIKWRIEGTTVLDEKRKLSFQKTERKKHKDEYYLDHVRIFSNLEKIGDIHQNPELLKQLTNSN
jgi:uncharacterized phage protein (TIGR01671 family)